MLLFLIGIVNVSAITSNEVTYENEGISETLTSTIDTLYRELKEYRTNGTVTGSEMLEGYTGYAKGKLINGSIPSKGSTTYTPGINNQVITKGQYLSEEQVILGDANLVSENIKEGVEIFGIKGSIKDNSGKTLEAINITSEDEFTYLNIPEEGIYDTESKVKVENSKLNSNMNSKIFVFSGISTSSQAYETHYPTEYQFSNDEMVNVSNNALLTFKKAVNLKVVLRYNNSLSGAGNGTTGMHIYKNGKSVFDQITTFTGSINVNVDVNDTLQISVRHDVYGGNTNLGVAIYTD